MRFFLIPLASLCVASGANPASADRAQYCERTNYTAQEITNAVRASPLRDELQSTSCSLGGLGRFESGGNKGVYNGSCCTGIFQLNNANIRNYSNNMTREEFGCSSLQNQADAWARLTNDGYNTPAVQQLIRMDTFDGQKIDAALIAACIQLGPGNCQQMVRSGRCSGFADSNGTTICDMARNARNLADPNCSENQASCGPGDFPNTRTTATASAAPPPAATDILVNNGQV
jgi:hypothetical protein